MSDEDEDEDEEPEQVRPTKRRPRYRELSTEDDEEDEDDNNGNSEEDEEDEDDGDDDGPVKHYTTSQMGQKGEPFTDADLYMAAKHAAQYNRWLEMSSKSRWEPFAEKASVLDVVTVFEITQMYAVRTTISEIMGGVLQA